MTVTYTLDGQHHVQEVLAEDLPAVMAIPVLRLPPLSAHACEALRRLGKARTVLGTTGSRLWVPRLGASFLVHGPLPGGWACTLLAVDDVVTRLPIGVARLCDVEVGAALAMTAAGRPRPLSTVEFCNAWRVRLADRGVPTGVVEAMVEATDPHGLTVDLSDRRVLLRSGCRTSTGFDRHCANLVEMGALHLPPGERGRRRAELTLPAPVWSW